MPGQWPDGEVGVRQNLRHQRVGILVDNLEPALDHQGRFIEPHRRYVELLRVLYQQPDNYRNAI